MQEYEIIRAVKEIILKHAKPERIYLYGSHATGDAKPGSDVDIALNGGEKLPLGKLESIREEVNQLPTLVKVDVTNLAGCEARFVNRVKTTGKVIYSASKSLRFEDGLYNFSRALERFSHTVEHHLEFVEGGFDDIYLDVAAKRFEFTYEMSWKAIKRYLDFVGLDCRSPRDCFQEAYAQQLIEDQSVWLDMIEMRNLSSHVYDENEIKPLINKLQSYLTAFRALHNKLGASLPTAAQADGKANTQK